LKLQKSSLAKFWRHLEFTSKET